MDVRKQNTSGRTPIVFAVGLVLLCLFVVSLNMTSGLYARYTTSVSGQASARIANFNPTLVIDGQVTELSTIVSVPFTPNEHYVVTIENQSEVAVQYSVSITNKTKNLPIKDVTAQLSQPIGVGEKQVIPLGIDWNLGQDVGETLDPGFAGMVDLLQVTIHIVQVD